MAVELDVKSTRAIMVTHYGATHWRVGDVMLATGHLVKGGFYQISTDTIALIPRDDVDPETVLDVLMEVIQTLIDTNQIREPRT